MPLTSRICRLGLLTVLGAAIAPPVWAAAPTATTGPAFDTDARSATLSGSVYPQGVPTSYHFEYGPTTFYGATTPDTAVDPGMTTVAAVGKLEGLRPAWTYHYRLVATSAGGDVRGFDRTFTTWGEMPAPVTPPPALPFAGVTLASSRLTVAKEAIDVKLSCPAGTVGRCSGRTTLTTRPRRASSTVLLGRARFSIGVGQLATVRVGVAREARRLLSRAGRLGGKATNAAHDADGVAETTVARVTIRGR